MNRDSRQLTGQPRRWKYDSEPTGSLRDVDEDLRQMADAEELVFIIDDDPNVRLSMEDLLSSVGYRSISLGSVGEYLSRAKPDVPSCLLLDIDLPDISGLEFQAQMDVDEHPPIIFVMGNGDIPSSVNAMKAGAVDFLTKPFAADALLAAIRSAVALDRNRRQERQEMAVLRTRYAQLTPREKEVLPLVVSGLMNKQAAAELGITEITFQVHRGKVMQKMSAASLADLVRMAARLGIVITHTRFPGASIQ